MTTLRRAVIVALIAAAFAIVGGMIAYGTAPRLAHVLLGLGIGCTAIAALTLVMTRGR